MNYLNAIKSIDHIIKTNNNLHENNCIFISGECGIGKIYSIKEWIKNNEEYYNVKYVSVFGKSRARDIENTILIKLGGLVDIKAFVKKKSRVSLVVRNCI